MIEWDKIALGYRVNGKPLTFNNGDRVRFVMGKTYQGRIETDTFAIKRDRRTRLATTYNIRFDSDFAVDCLIKFTDAESVTVV